MHAGRNTRLLGQGIKAPHPSPIWNHRNHYRKHAFFFSWTLNSDHLASLHSTLAISLRKIDPMSRLHVSLSRVVAFPAPPVAVIVWLLDTLPFGFWLF